ncbi:two component transcriptional regulator, LuxR family [Paenibacillus sophorae]|uniref:Response regulator transcription factor n=1 Tax=Paenibacillus sophorae TaxID=1333845 RepID=A0A1H8IT58_9BACL|nr:response regulator transcription factor [Paenibacillus sophorae]QWU16069.1 response regulator transcription factor [Paenibacillus sophorae]SEN71591.1 two component transcriptional regulator, LuxR family [Paenibacillus sophorae]
MENKIRVILVEDEPFWQNNISKYINKENDIEVVRIIDNGPDAVEATRSLEFDVILMDLNLSRANLDGLMAIRALSQAGHKVIALTAIKEQEVIAQSFESGAVNFINKSSLVDILRAIRDAHMNQIYIHPDGSEVLRKEYLKEIRLSKVLTPSERLVYDLRSRGLNKTQIAEQLHKSISTIKKQIRFVKDKLKEQGISF